MLYYCFVNWYGHKQACSKSMRELRKINIQASISKKRLTYNESWLNIFARVTTLLLFVPCILYPVIMMATLQFTNANELFFLYLVFPVSILIGIYGIFRGLTEKRLIKIETSHGKETITEAILTLAKENQLEIFRKSANCIILNSSDPLSFSEDRKKARIFFIGDGMLLFTVMRFGYKANYPVFFTHLFIKRDLSKLLRKGGVNLT